MKKVTILILVGLFLGFNALNASADVLVTGGYSNVDQSVMGARTSGEAFRTQVQIGAGARQHTAALDIASGAGRSMSNAGNSGGADFQWGQSQTEQSWKAAKTIEEAQVRGLVPGDCQGDNSQGSYRQQMNQNRKGYMSEATTIISNKDCGVYHKTLTGPAAPSGGSNDPPSS